MAVVQKGIAVAWGIIDGAYSSTGSATINPFSVKASENTVKINSKLEEHLDPTTGGRLGSTFFDPTKTVSLRVWPHGTTLSASATAGVTAPVPGDTFVVASGDDLTAGTYDVISVSRTRKVGGKTEFDVELMNYEAAGATTLIAS